MARGRKATTPRFTEAELEAKANALAQLARDPKLIPGIHNYCDRWCERCPQTARCLVFKTEQARAATRGRPARTDADNKEFWSDIGECFAVALHMVRRNAKKHGIDLDNPADGAAAEIEERKRLRIASRLGKSLQRDARAYWKAAEALLDQLPDELRSTEEGLNMQARLGAGDPRGAAAEIRDALDVVYWYLFFINVKLHRAISSRVDEQCDGDEDEYPSDANGSANIALIAMDRSLAAWARLRQHLESHADTILDLLVRLERLRRAAEAEFPRARAFRRPGFD